MSMFFNLLFNFIQARQNIIKGPLKVLAFSRVCREHTASTSRYYIYDIIRVKNCVKIASSPWVLEKTKLEIFESL